MKLEPVNDARERSGSVGARSLTDVLRNSAYGKVLRAVEQVTVFECKLPRIVVIGAENQGKSSTLERIAMRSVFPRLDGICTFIPISLKLRNAEKNNNGFIAVRRLSEDGEVLEESMFNSNDSDTNIVKKVSEMQTTALGGERTSKQTLEIEIHAPDVPDLTLVDLPGIVAYPNDVNQITTAMTTKFVEDENTLVICVASATMDSLRSSQAFQVLENDRSGTAWSRTLCVITKCDMAHSIPKLAQRIDKETDDTSMIQSQVVGVINRNTNEDEVSLETARRNERESFQNLRNLTPERFDAGKVGIDSVLLELDRMISKHVLNTWIPRQLELLDVEKQGFLAKLEMLGAPSNRQTLEEMKVLLNKGIVALVNESNFTTVFLEEKFQKVIQVEVPEKSQFRIQNPQRQRMQFFQKQKSFWNDPNQYERMMSTIFSQVVEHVLNMFDTDDLPIRFVRFVNLKNECTKKLMDCFQSRMETFVKCMKDVLHDFHMHETRQPITTSIDFKFEQIKTQYRNSMINTCVETCLLDGVESFLNWLDNEMPKLVDDRQLLVESCAAERKTLNEKVLKCDQAKSVIRRELA